MTLARERFWLWGHDAGSHNNLWNVPGDSRITPVEAAGYLGVPNVIMVRFTEASLGPTATVTVPFRALDKVVWSIVGAGGTFAEAETTEVLQDLPKRLDNLVGVMMDDFFRDPSETGEVGTLSTDRLAGIRQRLGASGRPLNLWVVLYDHQLDLPVAQHLPLCDKVTFWTWWARDIPKLEENVSRMEALAGSCGKVLGCYMWDYGDSRPMPVQLMRQQCELGLRWLREGRIEGMIFLASCICDLDLEAVEWTRQWIRQVGGQEL